MTFIHGKYYQKLFTAAVLIGCCFICSCENSQHDIDVMLKRKIMTEEATNVESFMSQEGKMKARLRAPLMIRVLVDSQYLEFPKHLHVDFFNDSTKQIETWLDAKYGKYYETLSKVYLRDSVVVITSKGDTLKSPDLWWDQTKGIFYTDKYAEYHAKDQDLTGNKGLIATQDLKTVTFKEPTGTVNVQDAGIAP